MRRTVVFVLSISATLVLSATAFAGDPLDATTTFTDEKAFLLANPSIAEMESFENLTATNGYAASFFSLPGFVLSTPDTIGDNLGVWDVDFVGGFATHGFNWVGFQSNTNERLRWTFESPISTFGLNITDWGDFGTGQLVFSNDAGDLFTVAVTPLANGNQVFFGVINDSMSFTTVELNQDIPGEFYGVDEVYFSPGECATPANLLVSQGLPVQGSFHYYYGGAEWPEMTAAINAEVASVAVTPNLENLAYMLGFDAVWIDQRGNDGDPGAFLTANEVNNIAAIIRTGRRVVMMGENRTWTNWNNQLFGMVYSSYGGTEAGGVLTTASYQPPTSGVDTVDVLLGGTVVDGLPLFSENVVTMWKVNRRVLTVLDINLWAERWADEDNEIFSTNVAKWIGCSAWQGFLFDDGFEIGGWDNWQAVQP